MVSDTAGISLADFFEVAVLLAEAVSYDRRGKRGTRSERRGEARTHVSKHPNRCPEEVGGRRRGELGLLPPSALEHRQEPGRAQEDGAEETHHRMGKSEDCGEEYAAWKKRRHQRNWRATRKLREDGRAYFGAGEFVVGTFNVRTLAFNGMNGIRHSEVVLKVCQEPGCDVIRFHETRRDGRSTFTAAGYTVALEQTAVSTRGGRPMELD